MLFISCVSHAFASVHCCLVVTCWEMADLFALFGDVYFNFVTFPHVVSWVKFGCLIASYPDFCHLYYLDRKKYVPRDHRLSLLGKTRNANLRSWE